MKITINCKTSDALEAVWLAMWLHRGVGPEGGLPAAEAMSSVDTRLDLSDGSDRNGLGIPRLPAVQVRVRSQ